MTSSAREVSDRTGEPIELYKFAAGTLLYLYTTAAEPVTFGGLTYLPAAVSHDAIKQDAELRQMQLTVSVPRTLPVIGQWFPNRSSFIMVLTLFTLHAGESDAMVSWIGRCSTPQIKGESADIICLPSYAGVDRPGLSRGWQPGCPLTVFSTGRGMCNADPVPVSVSTTLSSVSGLTVTAAAFAAQPDGYFDGGVLEWADADGNIQERTIAAHVGTYITLMYGGAELAAALDVTARPGCPGTMDACDTKFHNSIHYGGDLFMPDRNPYDGQQVY